MEDNNINQVVNVRHDWQLDEVTALFNLPFNDLVFKAQSMHRQYFDPNKVQLAKLDNIKTGACPEDCGYCSQSGHFKTGLEREPLLDVDKVLEEAKMAKQQGATRFCLAAAWRGPTDKHLDKVITMVKGVKALGLESCVSLGKLQEGQSEKLAEAGLDFYNHNLNTSPEFYEKVASTHTFNDRIDTVNKVMNAGVKVCSGVLFGMGETLKDRAQVLLELANLPKHPLSVPINALLKVPGTPMADQPDLPAFDFIRSIAVARILMPKSVVRISAGRISLNDQAQALCFLAGANSIFVGDVLLTQTNPGIDQDTKLLQELKITPEAATEYVSAA